jgi:hypothetical protein
MSENLFADAATLDDLYQDDFDAEDLKPKASQTIGKAGRYHLYCMAVKTETPDHTGMNSVVRLDFQVLAGEHADQKEHMLYHRVRLFKVLYGPDKKPIGREAYKPEFVAQAMRVARALGLIAKDGTAKLSQVQWAQAEGLQCVARVDEDTEEYDDKQTGAKKSVTRFQVNFGNFWRVDDEEVSDVPKDGEALAMLTGGAGIGDDDLENI